MQWSIILNEYKPLNSNKLVAIASYNSTVQLAECKPSQDLPLYATSTASMMLDLKPLRSRLCTPRMVMPLGEHTASFS